MNNMYLKFEIVPVFEVEKVVNESISIKDEVLTLYKETLKFKNEFLV